MSRIMFEKLTVEEEKEVRGGAEEESLPNPDVCDPSYATPPTRDCAP